jgi:hypothetical protein
VFYLLLCIITENTKKEAWVEDICIYNFKLEKLKGRRGFGELGLGLRIILKWILKQYDLKVAHNMVQGRAFVQSKIYF